MRRRRNRSTSRRSLPPSHTFVSHMNTMNGNILLNPQYDSSIQRNPGFTILANGNIPVTSLNPGLCLPPAAQVSSNQEQQSVLVNGNGHEELVAYSMQTNHSLMLNHQCFLNQDQSVTMNGGSGQPMTMTNGGQNMNCAGSVVNPSDIQLAYLQAYNYCVEENNFNATAYLLPMMPEIFQQNGQLLQQSGNSASQQNLVSRLTTVLTSHIFSSS